MLIGMASVIAKEYIATYNPNYYNQLTTSVDGETEEQRKRRTDGRWLLSFCQALEHTKRTGGYLVQVIAAHTLTLEPGGPAAEDPARGGFTLCAGVLLLVRVAAAADRPRGRAVQQHAGGGEEDGQMDGHPGVPFQIQSGRGQRD